MEKDEIRVVHMPAVAEIYDFAYESLQRLPNSFRSHLKNFVIEVKNFAENNVLEELSMTDRYDLLGLYRGVPLPLKKKTSNKKPDIIYLYRCPLIRHAVENAEDVKALIHHVLINEIGHHFGCTAHEMAWIHQHSKFTTQD
ncbi:MAG: metallopeptidase family protein [Proteobacteria bacterium]|jgi:predicted Zn-dependent protease with MMP-like domain|nr:metallopeptidase family protein [Pseudomonadota bacterium]